jgi:ribosomal-protein-alanine N-acetyltransferase
MRILKTTLIGKPSRLSHWPERRTVDRLSLYADDEVWTYVDTPPPNELEALTTRHRLPESRSSPDGSEMWLNFAVRAKASIIGFVEATVLIEGQVEIAFHR